MKILCSALTVLSLHTSGASGRAGLDPPGDHHVRGSHAASLRQSLLTHRAPEGLFGFSGGETRRAEFVEQAAAGPSYLPPPVFGEPAPALSSVRAAISPVPSARSPPCSQEVEFLRSVLTCVGKTRGELEWSENGDVVERILAEFFADMSRIDWTGSSSTRGSARSSPGQGGPSGFHHSQGGTQLPPVQEEIISLWEGVLQKLLHTADADVLVEDEVGRVPTNRNADDAAAPLCRPEGGRAAPQRRTGAPFLSEIAAAVPSGPGGGPASAVPSGPGGPGPGPAAPGPAPVPSDQSQSRSSQSRFPPAPSPAAPGAVSSEVSQFVSRHRRFVLLYLAAIFSLYNVSDGSEDILITPSITYAMSIRPHEFSVSSFLGGWRASVSGALQLLSCSLYEKLEHRLSYAVTK